MSVIIRELRDDTDDIASCLAIYNYYIENTTITFEEEPLTLEEFTRRLRGIHASFPFFVVEEGGRVVGYAYLDRFHPRSAYRFTVALSVYLDHNVRARGIGSQLLCRIEEAARERGLRHIVSLIKGENSGSVRFHEKHGFEKKGTLSEVGFKFDRRLDVMYYQKTL